MFCRGPRKYLLIFLNSLYTYSWHTTFFLLPLEIGTLKYTCWKIVQAEKKSWSWIQTWGQEGQSRRSPWPYDTANNNKALDQYLNIAIVHNVKWRNRNPLTEHENLILWLKIGSFISIALCNIQMFLFPYKDLSLFRTIKL